MAISANARAVGTIKNYLGTAMNSFAKYLAEAKVSFPEFVRTGFTEAHLAAFAMWMCAEHKSTQVIKTSVAGLHYFCVAYAIPVEHAVNKHMGRAPNQSRIFCWGGQVYEGSRRSAAAAKKKKKALPLTAPMAIALAQDCCERIETSPDKDSNQLQERAMHSLNFLGANRPSETMAKMVSGKLVCPVLRWTNIKFSGENKAQVHFPHTKAKKNVTVHFLATGRALCAVDSLKNLQAARALEGKAYPSDPVFLAANGVDPLSYGEAVGQLKNAVTRVLGDKLAKGVKGYSYRRGAATSGYLMGLSIKEIKTITRHSSDSVFNYIAAGKASSLKWQQEVAGLSPKLGWFGHMARDRTLRLHVANLDQWETLEPRQAGPWN